MYVVLAVRQNRQTSSELIAHKRGESKFKMIEDQLGRINLEMGINAFGEVRKRAQAINHVSQVVSSFHGNCFENDHPCLPKKIRRYCAHIYSMQKRLISVYFSDNA